MKKWIANLVSLYCDKRILIISFLGFVSGLPLLLTGSTLSVWLAEEGVAKATIGVFSLVGLPYTCKFLWAPLFDHAKIPYLTSRLGRRRSFLLLCQLLLMLALVGLGFTSPHHNPLFTAVLALCVAFLSASQDIVIDAYRVEILDEESYGAGAASIVFGYRVGMLMAGAGALYLASAFTWQSVYVIMAMLMVVGMLVCLMGHEPKNISIKALKSVIPGLTRDPCLKKDSLWKRVVLVPFQDFMNRKHWGHVLLLIVFYKLGDAFLTSMSNVFLIEIGFSKIEIANVAKIFGLAATLCGGFIAGAMSARLGVMRTMLICGVIHVVANFIFVAQAYVGYNLSMLVFTIAIENITAGMTAVALVAYISSLCSSTNTATQYAFLSSFMAIGRTVITSSSGALASMFGWPMYFVFTSAVGVPALLIVLWLMQSEQESYC